MGADVRKLGHQVLSFAFDLSHVTPALSSLGIWIVAGRPPVSNQRLS